MFVNLLNEDYYVSPVNGKRYEIKPKKLLNEPEGEPPRGQDAEYLYQMYSLWKDRISQAEV